MIKMERTTRKQYVEHKWVVGCVDYLESILRIPNGMIGTMCSSSADIESATTPNSQSVSQSASRSVSRSVSQSVGQSVRQSVSQTVGQSVSRPVSRPVSRRVIELGQSCKHDTHCITLPYTHTYSLSFTHSLTDSVLIEVPHAQQRGVQVARSARAVVQALHSIRVSMGIHSNVTLHEHVQESKI